MQKLIVIAIIIIILIYIFRVEKHEFWDKQPVIHSIFDNREGILSPNLLQQHNNQIMQITQAQLHQVISFLNKYYLKETINKDYINHITNLATDKWFAFNNKSNKLVGTIFAKRLQLIIKGNKVPAYYVDYLCVSERKGGLAPILITAVINAMAEHNIPVAIFKIDSGHQLPFQYVYSDNYYYRKLADNVVRKCELRELDEAVLERVYQYVKNKLKEVDLCEELTQEEFSKYYMPISGLIYSYYKIIDNKIVGFATLVKAEYRPTNISAIDLIYNLGIPVEEICEKVKTEAEYIYKIGYSPKFKKGRKTYIHLYNHGIHNINKICFNRH